MNHGRQQAEARRQAISEFVTANPGCSKRAVVRATGIPAGTCYHHVHRMIRHGLLVERRFGRMQPLFSPNQAPNQDLTAHFVLARQFPELIDIVGGRPGITESQALAAMAESHGWARSTTQHRLARLAAAGALTRTRGFRSWHYALDVGPLPNLAQTLSRLAEALTA